MSKMAEQLAHARFTSTVDADSAATTVLCLSRDVWSSREWPIRCPGSQPLRLIPAAQTQIPATGFTVSPRSSWKCVSFRSRVWCEDISWSWCSLEDPEWPEQQETLWPAEESSGAETGLANWFYSLSRGHDLGPGWVCVYILLSLWRGIQHLRGGSRGGDSEEATGG